MPLVPLELPLQSEPGRYGADGAARLINCYPEEAGRGGKIPFPIYASDGLTKKLTLASGGSMRGMIPVGNALYASANRQISKIDTNFSGASIGGFTGSGKTYFARNQKSPTPQIGAVSDGVRAIIENDDISAITDTDLQAPNSIEFLNQRWVTTTANGRFQWSALSEGSSWGALDFATAEYSADGLNRALRRRGELLLFGTETIEPFYNTDVGDAVFVKSGSTIERGCVNGATVAVLEETPCFAADDLTVRLLEGYSTRRISTHAVERSIRDTANRSNMRAFAYHKDGHSSYVLSGDDFTWQFDARTGTWHERKSYGLNRWRAQEYAPFNNIHVVGDYSSGEVYQIDEDAYDEDGDPLVMTVQIPVHAFPRKIQLNELRVDMIPGVGSYTSNPKLMVDVSKDGGFTFGNIREIPIGKKGERSAESRGYRFGISNEDGFVIRLSISAAVIRAITGVSADFDVLEN